MLEISSINKLTTEASNENTKNIDALTTLEMVKLINSEDAKVALSVEKESASIAKSVDEIAIRFKQGGRIIYTGAGSSGRMGTLDAVELTPTYNVSHSRAFGLIAGGKSAMFVAVEGAEDSKSLGISDLKEVNLNELDTVIAIAASGRTPYAIGSIEYGNEVGALTISITCNNDSEMSKIANISIAPIVGPEVIAGSTRMKAGTATKMILNMISTTLMIKIGYVYGNYMVNLRPTNEKLIERAITMVANLTKLEKEKAKKLFHDADSNIAVAMVMHKTGKDKNAAIDVLKKADNHIKTAIKMSEEE